MKEILNHLGIQEVVSHYQAEQDSNTFHTEIRFTKDGEYLMTTVSEPTTHNTIQVGNEERERSCRLKFFEGLLAIYTELEYLDEINELDFVEEEIAQDEQE
jgi:hypothetical protein